MTAKVLKDFELVPVSNVRMKGRARVVAPDAVAAMRQSFEDVGGITTPIHVRKMRKGFDLIDGAHRLTLAREVGLDFIPARIWDCTAEEARFFETDANLAVSHLTPVALARSLALRHEAYLKLHPGTAQGMAGVHGRRAKSLGTDHHNGDVQPKNFSFADFVGTVMGCTPRRIQQIVRAGSCLTSDRAEALERAPKRVTMDDLSNLAKIPEGDAEFDYVVNALATGEAKRTSQARRAYQAAQGKAAPVQSDHDKKLARLMDAWTRATPKVRRAFLEELGDEVAEVLDALKDADDTVVAFKRGGVG